MDSERLHPFDIHPFCIREGQTVGTGVVVKIPVTHVNNNANCRLCSLKVNVLKLIYYYIIASKIMRNEMTSSANVRCLTCHLIYISLFVFCCCFFFFFFFFFFFCCCFFCCCFVVIVLFFAKASSRVNVFDKSNKRLISTFIKLVKQGYQYHKFPKTLSKYDRKFKKLLKIPNSTRLGLNPSFMVTNCTNMFFISLFIRLTFQRSLKRLLIDIK